MRLLEHKGEGDISLVEFADDSIPRYAILSHTWGADHEEVTYRDLSDGTDKTKLGYKKIQFCADQAVRDGLRYFWVDTCCIDKSSSAELSEAINSMFAWYRSAAKCYVYLSDVPAQGFTSSVPSHETKTVDFQQSRWFTRGWTLQELIAPESVDFFSVEGQRLGDKRSMVHELHSITGISVEVLLGRPLHELSVEERMSWGRKRNTRRKEDAAYSLLGIFDVHMPLIYGEGQKKAFARLQKEINALSNEERTSSHQDAGSEEQGQGITARKLSHKPFSTVPFAPDADFVDRPDILAWMSDKCAGPGARAALVGLGGVGKSQLAIQYAHHVRDATPRTYVFWVHASTRARFEEAYRGLADRLELPGRLDPKADVLRLVSDWLCNEANGKWTMVVDNVDDVETFFPLQRRDQGGDGQETSKPLTAYLPQSRNGSILITSRSRDAAARLVGGHKNIREVLAMNESQGLQLLYNKLLDPSHEEGVAIELLRTLDCMPLAITQAAAYINRRSHLTISDYLDEFHANDKRRESLLNWDAGDLRRDESASNSVVTAWQISFERIRHERPSAAELLSLMSFFNPQGIPEKTLRRYSKTTAQAGVLGIEGETSRTIDEDFDTLHAFSLITVTTSTAGDIMWGMHALVQFCTRVWLSSYGEVERWKSAFLELLAKDFPIGEYENWKKCQQLLPHVEPLYDSELDSEQLLAAWAQVLTNAAWYLLRKGTYQTAQIVATKAVRARERVFGPEDERTMTSITVLAILLHHQGKYEEAEKLDRRALKGRERQLGAHHPSTLRSVENLASVLRAQGKYEESVKLNRRALKGYENELGGYYRDMLTCMKNLAAVLQDQGKYVEAEKLTRQALEGREKELGVYHPDTLTSVSDLALVLKVQGKYEEAEKLNRQALEGYEKELGSYHPDTLTSVNNLASVLQDQGHHDEAEKLNLRALEGRNQELGPYHPETLMSMNNLASVLQNQGKYDEAEKLNRQALEGCEKELGLNHPKTLVSVDYLALVLCRQGRYEEAEKLNRRAIAGYEKELGVHHPHTLTSLNNLALVLQDQGKYSEAEKINRRALEGSEKELGPHHPDTLNSTHCLAGLLRRLRQYDEAAKLYKRAYDGLIQEFGPQHPRTIACREDFSALQQEAKQAALDGKQPPLRGKDTIANNSPSEIAFARAGSKQKDKQESILARVKRRIRGRD